MFAALVSTIGCAHQTWEEVPVYYTDIYSIMPFDPSTGTGADESTYDMYEYMVFHEVNELAVYNTYNVINRYSTIENYVDNSVEVFDEDVDSDTYGDSLGLLYNFSFTEVIVSSSTSTDETTGESVTTETETRRYYTVIGEGVDYARNYGTVTIKDESGSVIRSYDNATVVVEQRWVDYDKKPN